MCFFRALLLEQLPAYSAASADDARADLAEAGVNFKSEVSKTANGFEFNRAKLGDDGFDAFLGNCVVGEWKRVILEVLGGFCGMGGCAGYSSFNCVQLKRITCGE